jgi:hypothetical protein
MTMKRRKFITLLGGAAATWPLGASAQESSQIARIGVLNTRLDDAVSGGLGYQAFIAELQKLGPKAAIFSFTMAGLTRAQIGLLPTQPRWSVRALP